MVFPPEGDPMPGTPGFPFLETAALKTMTPRRRRFNEEVLAVALYRALNVPANKVKHPPIFVFGNGRSREFRHAPILARPVL